ncbi:hypothetical protein GGI09_006520 [Coemansia sp. S100]|nr:hypothetical protein LPJ71_003353 [Coemansia sp. S17]KAJ2087501.1 hypothetical protein GGI09_006520 [Coemansia sp. S100]KAJ2109566.1 hypothetical protein GGI16_000679 [Coemansia sp. S142-1]
MSTATSMSPEQRATMVLELLQTGSKKEHICGKMTQLDHALQAAQLTKNEGADEETIMAALLLDIGHLIPPPRKSSVSHYVYDSLYQLIEASGIEGEAAYSRLGAAYLRKLGFSNKTSELVESNIQARRYLLSTNLNFQTGPNDGDAVLISMKLGLFSPTEKGEFEKDPLFKQKVQLAKWDDAAAKITGVKPPALDTYHDMIIRNLKQAV